MDTEKIKTSVLVGITGGMGSGKTTVAKLLSKLGYKIYYADERAKILINSSVKIKNAIKEAFGEQMYFQEKIDVKRMAQNVFSNKESLKKLNTIVHPEVQKDFEQWVKKNNTDKLLFKEAAILIESGAYKSVDKILLVTAPIECRIKRVMARDSITRQKVEERIQNQLSDEEKIKYADFVISNNTDELLLPQVLKFIATVT